MLVEKEKKAGLLKNLGSVSEERISLIAVIGISIAVFSHAVIAIIAMIFKTVDFSLTKHMLVNMNYLFPAICAVSFIVYVLVFLKAKNENASLKVILIKNPLIIVFSVLVIWMFISQVYNGLGYAMEGYFLIQMGETFDMEVAYFIFVLFCGTQVKFETHKRFLLRAHMLVSMLLVLAGFVLWKNVFDFELVNVRPDGFVSIYGNENHYGYYLALSVPLAGAAFLYEKVKLWKVIAFIAFMANTVALSLNDTMGSWLGGGLAVIFILITHLIVEKKVNWQAIILIPVFALCLYIPGCITGMFDKNFSNLFSDVDSILSGAEDAVEAGTYRWAEWTTSMEIIGDNKLFGVGFEGPMYRKDVNISMFKKAGNVFNARPHNEFLEYAVFYGLPVGVLYFAGCLGVFIRALKKKKIMDGATLVCLAAAFGYLASSFFGCTVFNSTPFLFIFLGMGYVREKTVTEETQKAFSS